MTNQRRDILILSAGYFIESTELLEKVSSCFYMCTNRRLPVSSSNHAHKTSHMVALGICPVAHITDVLHHIRQDASQ